MPARTSSSRLGLKIGVVLLVLVGAGFAVFYALRPTAQVVLAFRDDIFDARPGSVTVMPGESVPLTSEIRGRVVKSALDEGEVVKAGDFLVQLDTSDLDLQIEKAKNDIDTLKRTIAVGSSIEIDLATAKADLAKYQHLFTLGQ